MKVAFDVSITTVGDLRRALEICEQVGCKDGDAVRIRFSRADGRMVASGFEVTSGPLLEGK